MNEQKYEKYRDLIARVKDSYPRYERTEDGEELKLYWCDDCEEINLWAYWQGRGNLDAKILLVGQDWGCPWDRSSQDCMKQISLSNQDLAYDYLDNNYSITDNRLVDLFQVIGYDITKSCPDLFFTNFVLGYRNKGTSGGYKREWADHDKGYFKELADIITPKVILCLGRSTFEGVLSAFDLKIPVHLKGYNDLIESVYNPVLGVLENGEPVYIFALAHCGAMGTLNRNRKESTALATQIEDWRRIIPYIKPSENIK